MPTNAFAKLANNGPQTSKTTYQATESPETSIWQLLMIFQDSKNLSIVVLEVVGSFVNALGLFPIYEIVTKNMIAMPIITLDGEDLDTIWK